jgi:hypothetical protein
MYAITLDKTKTIVEIGAILIGGIWVYLVFVRNREKYPRVETNHLIHCLRLSEEKILIRVDVLVKNLGPVLLKLWIGVVRAYQFAPITQEILLEIDPADSKTEPFENRSDKNELHWKCLCEKSFDFNKKKKGESFEGVAAKKGDMKQPPIEIEPEEEGELSFDLIIPAGIESVLIYTYLENQKKKRKVIPWVKKVPIGWLKTTVYEIQDKQTQALSNSKEE